jgi:hypothetical protein
MNSEPHCPLGGRTFRPDKFHHGADEMTNAMRIQAEEISDYLEKSNPQGCGDL